MTREEAIERLKQNKAAAEFYAGMIDNYKSVCNELKDIEAFDMAIEALSAEAVADRPTGEWKKIDTWKYCSECGWTIYTEDDRVYNYCPNCGAKMTKGGDTE